MMGRSRSTLLVNAGAFSLEFAFGLSTDRRSDLIPVKRRLRRPAIFSIVALKCRRMRSGGAP